MTDLIAILALCVATQVLVLLWLYGAFDKLFTPWDDVLIIGYMDPFPDVFQEASVDECAPYVAVPGSACHHADHVLVVEDSVGTH